MQPNYQWARLTFSPATIVLENKPGIRVCPSNGSWILNYVRRACDYVAQAFLLVGSCKCAQFVCAFWTGRQISWWNVTCNVSYHYLALTKQHFVLHMPNIPPWASRMCSSGYRSTKSRNKSSLSYLPGQWEKSRYIRVHTVGTSSLD